jgi:phenylpropionate dioxygenase-like ring-hydroxylating dioxygenase large terminal subunit
VKRIPLPPFPNGWFKVCFTDELGREAVVPSHVWGRDLVAFRGADGRARVLEAYCPHLGAHIGHGGKVEGDTVRCPFHGWRFEGGGRCVEVPYAKKIPARAELASFPAIERNGYVAAWFHAEGKPPSYDIPAVPEVEDAGFYFYKRRRWELDTHLQEVYENAVDVKHFAHVHGMEVHKVNWIPDGAHVTLELDIKREDATAQTDEAEQSSFRSFMWGPGLSLTRVSGKMRGVSVQTLTPLEDERIEICHSYYARRSEPLSQQEIEGFFDFYASDWELDYNLWNHKIFRPTPVLAEGDGDIGRYRRWYKQFYSEDVRIDF